MSPKPCPQCGKKDMLNKAGLCNFRWTCGDWVIQRSHAMTADTPYITCDRCAVTFDEADQSLLKNSSFENH